MTKEIVKTNIDMAIVERVLLGGDLSQLTDQQRVAYYMEVCQSLNLNPLTRPFDYLLLDDSKGGKKLVLYARKDCADQLRDNNGISVTRLERERMGETYIVTAYGRNAQGREDSATGVVALERENGEWKTSANGKRYFVGDGTWTTLRGDALANALMKAETKAKRRLTLSLCGLGMADESEIETIPGAQPVTVTPEGEIVEPPAEPQPKPPTGSKEARAAFNDVARSAMAKGWTQQQVAEVLAQEGDYTKATNAIITSLDSGK
jgi:hypothetical protein